MIILKRYKPAGAHCWLKVSSKEFIDETEIAGFWEKDTVRAMLDKGESVFTPFAEWKKETNLIYACYYTMQALLLFAKILKQRIVIIRKCAIDDKRRKKRGVKWSY